MTHRLFFAGLVSVIVVTLTACGSKPDTAKPVATPAVTLTPADAAVGSPVDMSYRFSVAADAPAFTEDYWVFVHFLDADGELMWTDDHQPPVPTTQWKPGATVEYARTMFVPKFPYVGSTRVQVGLYSPKSGERLPLSGQAAGQREYQVASFNLRLQSDNLFVVFKDGWQETETSAEGNGLEWQWSKKDATLAFRNPMRDAIFYLQVDQPVAVFTEPQNVEVRIGETVVDRFALAQGPRELRKIAISQAQFGADETVEMTIAADRTFVPAQTPALKSTDPRELGIRVFRAFVAPK